MEVLAVGAGSAGLLLAQGLKQQGIKCTVYEREDVTTYQTRPREWGMTLHWGSDFVSKCIPPDLYARLNEGICSDPYTKETPPIPNYNGATGEKLFDMGGTQPRRVSRRKMRNFLSQGLDIEFGKRIQSVTTKDGKVVATFEDGTSASGDVLIGCDGSKSKTRECLVGPEQSTPEDLDNNMFNVTCRFTADTARLQREGHPGTYVAFHPKGFVWMAAIQDISEPDKPETWLFQHILSWMGEPRPADLPDQASRLAFWKSTAGSFAEPWHTVGEEFPDDLKLQVDRITAWRPTMDWSGACDGQATLAGDSAHTMPPHRAQGLNNALEDAATLVDELAAAKAGTKTIPEALRAYEVKMKERVLQEIPISIRTAVFGHNFEKLMQTPAFKNGMNKYKTEREESGQGPELAA